MCLFYLKVPVLGYMANAYQGREPQCIILQLTHGPESGINCKYTYIEKNLIHLNHGEDRIGKDNQGVHIAVFVNKSVNLKMKHSLLVLFIRLLRFIWFEFKYNIHVENCFWLLKACKNATNLILMNILPPKSLGTWNKFGESRELVNWRWDNWDSTVYNRWQSHGIC